jgi:hypothetical protein
MSDEKQPKLEIVSSEQLDEDEAEFRALRCDLPGVQGASAVGIVSIGVGKLPGRNEFFQTHPDFRPSVFILDHEVGLEKQFFAVADHMVQALLGIGITQVGRYTLYLTVTSRGAVKIIPVRQAGDDGEQNDYHRTKEVGLLQAMQEWKRLYVDQENKVYKTFPALAGRFGEPIWPALKPAKIFRLAFRDKGRLIDSPEHELFQRWAARDRPS